MALGTVGQIHISVTDLDRSIAFYRDVLGIPFLFQAGPAMAFFQAGEARLYLGIPTSPEYTSRCVLYFRVDDLTAEVERLTGLDVQFSDKPHLVHRDGDTELWMAGFTDPDGHHLILMEERTA
jgi:predicted enzyme related to lactoylglutathione lyase